METSISDVSHLDSSQFRPYTARAVTLTIVFVQHAAAAAFVKKYRAPVHLSKPTSSSPEALLFKGGPVGVQFNRTSGPVPITTSVLTQIAKGTTRVLGIAPRDGLTDPCIRREDIAALAPEDLLRFTPVLVHAKSGQGQPRQAIEVEFTSIEACANPMEIMSKDSRFAGFEILRLRDPCGGLCLPGSSVIGSQPRLSPNPVELRRQRDSSDPIELRAEEVWEIAHASHRRHAAGSPVGEFEDKFMNPSEQYHVTMKSNRNIEVSAKPSREVNLAYLPFNARGTSRSLLSASLGVMSDPAPLLSSRRLWWPTLQSETTLAATGKSGYTMLKLLVFMKGRRFRGSVCPSAAPKVSTTSKLSI
ncbi:hypothetical protein M011DRAFT_524674 [Sporormia fimetaria CBS 119925]|uniref:Uncharacterized protein n=1 Tax=Sporormia fimetaria CBS 119925 TaxID=1340428 RepID=A0A6A6VHX6_9PLEO|nr:hypothetical protein M011DRAFT_524674 [Sporormia fimetaria CBS 119925]